MLGTVSVMSWSLGAAGTAASPASRTSANTRPTERSTSATPAKTMISRSQRGPLEEARARSLLFLRGLSRPGTRPGARDVGRLPPLDGVDSPSWRRPDPHGLLPTGRADLPPPPQGHEAVSPSP